jgi:hypothetical protein
MNKIKFRGITKAGKWIYGCLIYYGSTTGIIEERDFSYSDNGSALDFGYTPVIPKTVGQFIDILDKNGKEIYEGDKIKANFRGMVIKGIIIYFNGCYCLGSYEGFMGTLALYMVKDIEVIGNIQDNPELLQSKIGNHKS